MDILTISINWAKDEVFSSRFFILFAIMFLLAAAGFWYLGKTEMARAFITPTLVAGLLLLAVGVGIFFTNKSRVNSFAKAYQEDPVEFVTAEMARTQQSFKEYKTGSMKPYFPKFEPSNRTQQLKQPYSLTILAWNINRTHLQ